MSSAVEFVDAPLSLGSASLLAELSVGVDAEVEPLPLDVAAVVGELADEFALLDAGAEVPADEDATTGTVFEEPEFDVTVLDDEVVTPGAEDETSLDVGEGLLGPASFEPQALKERKGPMNQMCRKSESLMNAPRCQLYGGHLSTQVNFVFQESDIGLHETDAIQSLPKFPKAQSIWCSVSGARPLLQDSSGRLSRCAR